MAGSLALARAAGSRRSVGLWAGGFAALGVAAVLGGTWHAWSSELTPAAADLLWKATLAAAGVAGCLLIAGTAYASIPPLAAAPVGGAAAIKLALFLAGAVRGDSFDPAVVDSAVTLGTVLALQVFAFATRRSPSAPWVIGGVAVSLGAAAVEAFRPDLPGPFGPDAVYHLVQITGLLLFYRGARLFEDR